MEFRQVKLTCPLHHELQPIHICKIYSNHIMLMFVDDIPTSWWLSTPYVFGIVPTEIFPMCNLFKDSLNFGTATIYIYIYIYQDIPLSESEAIPNDRHVSSSSFHSTEAPNGLTQTAPKCMGVYLQNSALSMYIYIYCIYSYYFICTHLCGSDVTYTYTYTCTYI